ncbi:MAG: DUF4115 domain-containing protein [Chloroflexi bacterium]|nr:DUF4115 domain-containing protein [Chloroflexota bacterium]
MDAGLGPSIGALLRQARGEKALSLADVQQTLRVSQRYLQALEADDYAALPPGVYARALIRQYAALLGLDPTELLARYGRARPVERDIVRPALPAMDRPPIVSLKAIVTVLVVATGVGLFAYLQAQYNSLARSLEAGGGAVTAPALPTQTGRSVSALLTPFPTATSPPPPTSLPSPTPVTGLLLEARTTERSWVQVWVDGNPALAETLPSGTLRTFSGRQGIRLRVGNAAGIEISVNGVPQGPLGQRGQAAEATWIVG